MFINILLLICALCLSTVAAYYSVIGLGTIFAGAFWPVIIMGSLLEASKLVVSSWLYRKWKLVPLLLKTYLTTAVIVLMIITSIGIFGFLSKAHIEQTGQIQENVAQIERYTAEISRQKFLYQKAEERLKQLENVGTGSDVNIQNQINAEQQRIDTAYKRIQPAIDEQNKIIEGQTKIITDQIADIDKQLETLQKYIDLKEIEKAQSLVGTRADGSWGPGTAAAVKTWQQNRKDEKTNLISKLEDINKNNLVVKSARDEIQRIRQTVETQVAESNKLINRLREQVGKTKVEDISVLITEQQEIIKSSNREIDSLSEKKFNLETQYRKLEAEVGPIKYIANFIYDSNTDKNLLEKSVTWMILVIIFVFDPLAVLMIIAANIGFTNFSTRSSRDDDSGHKKPSKKFSDLDLEKSNNVVINVAQKDENAKKEDINIKLVPTTNIWDTNNIFEQSNEPNTLIKDPNLKKNDINEVNQINEEKEVEETSVNAIEVVNAAEEVEDVTPVNEVEEVTSVNEVEDVTPVNEVEDVTPVNEVEDVTPVNEVEDVTPVNDINQILIITNPETIVNDTNLKKNDVNEVLTVTEPVLQSIVTPVETEDTNKPIMTTSNMNIIKLNADEILQRISTNRPLVRYDSRREWNGYKH